MCAVIADTPFIATRILCFVPTTDNGGVATYTSKWAHAVQSLGLKVEVIFWRDLASPYSEKVDLAQFKGLTSRRIEFSSLNNKSIEGARLRTLLNLSADGEVPVFLSASCSIIPYIVRDRAGRKFAKHIEVIVCDDHTCYGDVERAAVSADAFIGLGARTAKRAAKVLSRIESTVNVYAFATGSSVDESFSKCSRVDRLRLCYVGRLDPIQKRIYDLLEIAILLKTENIPFELSVIGGGSELERLQNLASATGLSELITFHGHLRHQEVRALLRDHDVFIMASAFEGFSGALCEAMGVGLVPVVTKVSGSEDVVIDGESGFLVDVGDILAFCRRVKFLADHPETLQLMAFNAWEKAKSDLSVEAVAKRLALLIQEICQKEEAPAATSGRIIRIFDILDSSFCPNPVSRCIRILWRRFKGLPQDVSQK